MPEPPLDATSANRSSTKQCDYCGKENAEDALACDGCGTPFPIPSASAPEEGSQAETSSTGEPPQLNARSATFIFLITIAAQVGAAFAIGLFVAVGTAIAQPTAGISHDPNRAAALARKLMPPATIAAMVGGGGAMLLTSRRKVPASLSDRSPVGAAWALGSLRQIAVGCALGALVAVAFLAPARIPALRPTHFAPGPLTRMGMTHGLTKILRLAMVVLWAPLMEELLFRGVLYGGYRRSFGPTRAALLTTLIFWALHMTEFIHFPLAAFAIAAMAVVALWMRLRSSAIGPAVAAHFSYNSVLALLQIAASFAKH